MKNKLASLFEKKPFKIVVSFIIACFLWFIVSYYISSEYSVSVRDVPITITSSNYTNYGLQIAGMSPGTVTVTVEGDRTNVGSVRADDIVVSPSLASITNPGTYELNLTATKANPLSAFQIVSISPSTVTLKFDVSESAMFPVETYISGIDIPEEFITGTITTTPETVTVWGPSEDVDKIHSIVARESLTGTQTETQTIVCKLAMLDEEGNELKLPAVSWDTDDVEVTIPILKRAEIPVRVEFINVPQGFNTGNLHYKLSMDNVLVAGQASLIDTMNASVKGYIDLSVLDPNVPVRFNMNLPSGLTNLTGIDSIAADFSDSDLEEKEINVSDLRFENVPTGYSAEFQQDTITSVTVVGPKEVLESLPSTSVIGIVDFNDFTLQLGTSTAAVSFRVPSSDAVWVTGKYSVLISVQAAS